MGGGGGGGNGQVIVGWHHSVRIRQVIGRKEMFYLMTHSTHFIYGYMA